MKTLLWLLLGAGGSVALAQSARPAASRKEIFTDDNGQRISFKLPPTWTFSDGILRNAAGKKVGEFTPGTLADCTYTSGSGYLQELRAGYADDMGNPRFVGARTFVAGPTTWTEGVRNIPAWDGKSNTGRWYSHSFFGLLNKKCFVLTFYSPQRPLLEEDKVKGILASLALVQ
jgi:hypothetical protein